MVPEVHSGTTVMLSGAEIRGVVVREAFNVCAGQVLDFEVNRLLAPVWDLPLLWFGATPLIALAWGAAFLSERAGCPRFGRILARSAAVVVIVRHLPSPLLFMFDVAGDSRCAGQWGPPGTMDWYVTTNLYHLVPVALVFLAARAHGLPPRGPLAHTVIAGLLVVVMLLGAAADTFTGRASDTRALDCSGSGDGTASGPGEPEDERRKGFLCEIREGSFGVGVPQLADMPDRELLAYGDHLCDLAVRNGGDVRAPAVSEAIGGVGGGSLVTALGRLCPQVAEVERERERRAKEENDAFVAAAERSCAAHPRHRPRIRPVRQARATMWADFWNINAWDEGNEGGPAGDMVAGLVGSGPGALDIWAADEIGHACVTGEAYRRRPPVETRGWEQVVEVGYETRTGVLSIVDGEGSRLPDLTAGGPGDYRVRVHVRGRRAVQEDHDAPDGTVQLLIMVFPGKAREPRIYRDSLSS